MKTTNRQRNTLLDEDRQRQLIKVRQIIINTSWIPLVLTLLFLISLSLTYILIKPESQAGLTSTILSQLPLLNNHLALYLGLAALSLLGIMWLAPQKVQSSEQSQSPTAAPFLSDDLVDEEGHSLPYPMRSAASTNVPLKHIQRIPLYSTPNQPLLP